VIARAAQWDAKFVFSVAGKQVEASKLPGASEGLINIAWKASQSTEVYMSERTRRPWLRRVELKHILTPDYLAAMQAGYVTSEQKVAGAYLTDLELPAASVPISDKITDYVKRLTAAL